MYWISIKIQTKIILWSLGLLEMYQKCEYERIEFLPKKSKNHSSVIEGLEAKFNLKRLEVY